MSDIELTAIARYRVAKRHQRQRAIKTALQGIAVAAGFIFCGCVLV